MTTPIGAFHEGIIMQRRVQVLARWISDLVQGERTLLDIGCGDGSIDLLVQQANPSLSVRGVDVLVRPAAKIPVERFDGRRLPFDDNSFDVVMCIDVLHHTDDPTILMREAKRVGRNALILKDHTMEGVLSYQRLRLMDWVGNAHHGVLLPYNYWRERTWRDTIADIGFQVERWETRLGLYPWPASLIFDRRLHFI